MSKLWSPFVRELEPYVPGEQPKGRGVVKLNTNENPFPPSPRVLEAICQNAGDNLRLYPDPESQVLREVIAKYHSDNSNTFALNNIFVGNGSDEVLAHAFNAFFRRGAPVLFPDITYSFYPVYCRLYGVPFEELALGDSYRISAADYGRHSTSQASGVIFPNPNAPTGILLDLKCVQEIVESNREAVVIVDEAYIDYAQDEKIASAMGLIDRYPNLLVIRTLSKSRSLAGIRLGYAMGHPDLIEALNRVKNSFNSYPVDRLAQVAAAASFADEDYFQQCRKAVIAQREWLVSQLEALGFSSLPSSANFIMTTHSGVSAELIAQSLRANNIIVRYFKKPRLDNHLRISVGAEQDNQALIKALRDML